MKYFYADYKNKIDFFLRNLITISRKNYKEIPVNCDCIFDDEEERSLYNSLKQKYDLSPLYKYNDINFLTNLFFLNIFDKYILPEGKNISVLDIGSKNWNYAGSEYVFFKHYCDNLNLNGIELDAYRVCTNLFNRYEIAKFYINGFENTNYIAGDFMNHNQRYDYIIWILPFITEYPHIRWGLPLKYFKPEEMLKHAYNLLNEGGQIFIINQGESEYNIQKELYKKLCLAFEEYGVIENKFNLFRNQRFCSKIIKKTC